MIKNINFRPGDIVRVHQKIKEVDVKSKDKGEKVRVQVFEGVVLSMKGRGENKSFTVRKTVEDVAVEKIFPVGSPNIEKVDVKSHLKSKVRRAKLTYLRKS